MSQRRRVHGMHRFSKNVLNVALPAWLKLEVSGAENLPEEGGFLLACNHISLLDGPVAFWALARHGVELQIMAKAELFKVPVLKHLFKGIKMVPVDRKAADRSKVLTPTLNALKAGGAVAIYPEGTLTGDPELWPMKLKTGAARLALDAGVPVVPFAIWGSEKVVAYGSRPDLRPRRPIRCKIGAPIDLSDLTSDQGSQDRNAVEAANVRILHGMRTTLAELRGEEAPQQLWDPTTESYIELLQA